MKTVRNYNDETVGSTIHVFERAGHGKAPFKFVGFEEIVHIVPGESPMPGSSCDFCGTGIRYVYWILSSDGNLFKVGCDCVAKTGDYGLRKVIDAHVAEHKRNLANKRADAKIEAGMALLQASEEKLKSMPHPNAYFASTGKTMLDWCNWMLHYSGRKGKLEVVKKLKEITNG